jgi:hypothetical protein
MAVTSAKKDERLMYIASAVGKGVMHFEGEGRPALQMGGSKVFVSSVCYDMDSGRMSYRLAGADGNPVPGQTLARPLDELDVKALGDIERSVRSGVELRRSARKDAAATQSAAAEGRRRAKPSVGVK